MSIIKPTEVESAINDIINYWKTSKAKDADKLQVLELLADHYTQLATNFEGEIIPGVYDSLRQIVNRVIEKYKK